MATAEQLKAMVRSHAEGDDSQFYAVAIQVAAHAARAGQHRLAQDLRDLVDEVRGRRRAAAGRPVPVVRPRGELAEILTAEYPETRLSDMSLAAEVRAQLERVLVEQRHRDQLRHRGFQPQRKLLFVGPPGTGKTMAASALAGELTLPLFTTRLEGLLTKYMGETAVKLRVLFDAIADTRGVYFFDEVDAVAGHRHASNDVGEIRRVLNSFLQFLEQDRSDSLIIGATNNPQLLDRALFRRFDNRVGFAIPSDDEVEAIVRNRLTLMKLERVRWPEVRDAAAGLSHADVSLASERAAKDAILAGSDMVESDELVSALRMRHHSDAD